MSRLAEFRKLEEQLAAQLQELEKLKNDEGLKREIEFEQKLRDLMLQYEQDLGGIIDILEPKPRQAAPKAAAQPAATRRARQVKVYKNPETGEVVETKGGNHKVLKAWKEKYGAEAVDSWVQ
ncbi:histone-like nucleoid-structuring protein, MvaT/MvaU family [Stutzerimonas tarimensis]|uniref:Histone-like nucleoid-structuring protein, MvaT/MvaU family n=1 Tax=Stutzerimonas tarimensis TaxID=1507735 RepID=A0ABV7T6M1_9GAMM